MAVGKQTTAAVPARPRVSLLRDNFTKGGVLPEGDYQVMESSFVIFAYTDKDGKPTGAATTAKRLLLQPMTLNDKRQFVPDATQQPSDQHWSIGDMKNFIPSPDGNFLEAVSKSSMSQQCKYYFLYDALVSAGVPEQLYDQEGAKLLIGMIGHITHVPAPDYSSMRQRNASAVGTGAVAAPVEKKRDFPETIPVFKVIHVAPWDRKGGAVKPVAVAAAPKTNGTAALAAEPEPEETEETESRLANFVKSAVVGAGGKISRTKCRLEVHKEYNKSKIDATERDAEMKTFDDVAGLGDLLSTVNCVIDGANIEYVE